MTERYRTAISPTLPELPTIDVLGSGPEPITPREGPPTEEALSQPGWRIALRDDVGPGIADSLLRYVSDFGQGKGTTLVEDGLTWLDLQFREDREMLKSQFRDLLASQEAAHERCV